MTKDTLFIRSRIFFLLVIFCGALFSIAAGATPTKSVVFDIRTMSAELNTINHRILNADDTYQDLTEALHELNLLQQQVRLCIQSGENRLNKVNQLLNKSELSNTLRQDTPSYRYLFQEKQKTLTQVERCNFLNYRLDEILDTATDKINKVNKFKLSRKTPIWDGANAQTLFNIQLNAQSVYMQSGINQLDKVDWFGLALTFMMGLVLAMVLRKISASSKNPITRINRSFILYILPLSFACIYLNVLFMHESPPLIGTLCINAITFYVIALFIIKLYFTIGMRVPSHPIVMTVFQFTIIAITLLCVYTLQFLFYKYNGVPLSYVDFINATYVIVIMRLVVACLTGLKQCLSKALVIKLQDRLFVIATFSMLLYVLNTLLGTQPLPPVYFSLLDTLYITLLNVSWLWLIYPFITHWVPGYSRNAAKILLAVMGLSIILAVWHGYHYLGVALIPNLIITAFVIIIMLDIHRLLGTIYSRLTTPNEAWSQKFHRFLGLKTDENLVEIYILLLLAALPAFILGALSILEIWGVTRYQIFIMFNDLHQGVPIFGGSIRPALVLRAITFFCFIVLFGRAFASYIVRTKLANEEQHTKIILFSLTAYISYGIALLIALYIAGFNFRNLVVVAGAFSVGLGFGLQNFAKDFICGLIIMLSKPIKIGDHIEVGDRNRNEGFVRNIGMLSTQMHTLSYSDVIIPNSEIITKIITNFTFQNNALSRIKLTVKLDESTDFDLAKQWLLDVATQNPNVIKEPPYEPIVLFDLYGLTLWFVMDDVNQREKIISNLNLAIADGLKELS